MSYYYFDVETVLNNAFYAIQDYTHFLTYEEIALFCKMVAEEVAAACRHVVVSKDKEKKATTPFDLDSGYLIFAIANPEDPYYEDCNHRFIRVKTKILQSGPAITAEEIALINARYESLYLHYILAKVQQRFKHYIIDKDMTALGSCDHMTNWLMI